MTAREFFYLTASMRCAQKEYFRTREQAKLRACKMLEKEVDAEIARVNDILARRQKEQ